MLSKTYDRLEVPILEEDVSNILKWWTELFELYFLLGNFEAAF